MTPADLLSNYAARRDAEAFAEIVRLHQRMVFATCRRNLHDPSDLDDAVQETFLRLAQKAGELKTNLAGWLYRCAANVATDINRRRASRQKHETAAARLPAQGLEEDPQRQLAELREHIDAAMKRLDPDEADLITERFFVGRPQTELAAELGLSPAAISARLNKAVEALRRHLVTMGCAAGIAGGAVALVGLLEAETASATVPAALTANIVKIGLSAIPAKAAGAAAMGPLAMELLLGIAAIAVVVIGIWYSFGRKTAPTAQLAPEAPSAQPTGITTGAARADDPATVPPRWNTTQPAVAGAMLSGHVVDRAGKPVASAIISLDGTHNGQRVWQAKTDAQGIYAFTDPAAAGEYHVGVQAAGFVEINGYASSEPGVQLTPSSNARRDLILDRGVSVQVSITDITGQPVGGRMLVFADNQGGTPGRRGQQMTSDNLGRATFVLATSATPYVIAVRPTNFAPAYALVTAADPDQPKNISITVDHGITVEGTAICTDGKPATGWQIFAQPSWWIANSSPTGAAIDKSGHFELTDVSPDQYAISIYMPDEHTSRPIATANLPPAESPLRVNVPLSSPSSRVKVVGHIRFIGGPTPDDLRIEADSLAADHESYDTWLENPGGKTDVTYTFPAIPPGPYRLSFESSMIKPKTIERVQLPDGIQAVELVVVGRPKLTGTITDAATGAAIPHFAVRLNKLETIGDGPNYTQDARWTQVSDAGGKYNVELVGPGIYQAQVSVEGYAWIWSPKIRVEGGTAELNLKVSPGGSLSGMVLDPSGKPVAGAKVIPLSMAKSVVDQTGDRFDGEAGAVITGADGRFTIPHLAEGAETVKIIDADFAPLVVPKLTVTDGKNTDADPIKLSAGGTVEGVVYSSEGFPESGVTLQFQDASGYSGPDGDRVGRVAMVTSDRDGKYRAPHLPAQILYVNVGDRWNRSGVTRRIVRPVEGHTAQLDFGGSAALSGRLLVDGQPLASKRIILAAHDQYFGPMMMNGMTGPDGRFTLHGPPPGKYTIFCQIGSSDSDWTAARDLLTRGQALDIGDVALDLGDVAIQFTADDPADLKLVNYVVVSPPQSEIAWQREISRAAPASVSPGAWRAVNVTPGKLVVEAVVGGFSLNTPFERKAGAAETAITIHIPHPSATVTLAPVDTAQREDATWKTIVFRRLDKSIEFVARENPSGQNSGKVPAGTYQRTDPRSRLPIESLAPIVLKEGESREFTLEATPPLASLTEVSFQTWTPDGVLVTDAALRLLDAGGATVKSEGDTDLGPTYVLKPGHFRAILDLPGGKSITHEIDITGHDDHPGESRWRVIELVTE